MTIQTAAPADSLGGSLVTYQRDPSTIGGAVARYANEIGECMALATQIVDTPIVPAAYWPSVVIEVGGEARILKAWEWDPRRKHPRESAEDYAGRRQVAIATTGGVIHVGITLGHASYYQSISGIYFVGGRPALTSEEMRSAIIRAGHYFRVIERGDERAVVEVLRRGEKAEPRRYVFTMADAIRAGYVPGVGPNAGTNKFGKAKSGGNEKYLTDPATMLLARVTTVAGKVEFPDVIRGLAPDEHLDEPVDITATSSVSVSQVSVEDIARPPQRTGALASLETRTLPTPTPEAPEVIDLRDQPSSEGENPDTPQVSGQIDPGAWRAINARFVDLGTDVRGLTGPGQKEARLQVISAIVDRAIAKGSDLTAAEGQLVLDQLAGQAGERICQAILYPQQQDDVAAEAQQHAAGIDEQIAAARADADARAAQHDAEQAQADSVDPTVGDDPWAGAGQ